RRRKPVRSHGHQRNQPSQRNVSHRWARARIRQRRRLARRAARTHSAPRRQRRAPRHADRGHSRRCAPRPVAARQAHPGPRHARRRHGQYGHMNARRHSRWAAAALVAAGAAHSLTFAPGPLPAFALALVQIVALACVAHATLQAPGLRPALLRGWLFNFATYSIGLYWIFVSLHRYGGLAAPLAVAGVLALSAFLALFPAAACVLARWLCPPLQPGDPDPAPARRLLITAIGWASAWGLFEWLRATVLTGFPWLNIGYAHVDSPLAGWAPVLGVHGLALLAAFLAAALAGLWQVVRGLGHLRRHDARRGLACAL